MRTSLPATKQRCVHSQSLLCTRPLVPLIYRFNSWAPLTPVGRCRCEEAGSRESRPDWQTHSRGGWFLLLAQHSFMILAKSTLQYLCILFYFWLLYVLYKNRTRCPIKQAEKQRLKEEQMYAEEKKRLAEEAAVGCLLSVCLSIYLSIYSACMFGCGCLSVYLS